MFKCQIFRVKHVCNAWIDVPCGHNWLAFHRWNYFFTHSVPANCSADTFRSDLLIIIVFIVIYNFSTRWSTCDDSFFTLVWSFHWIWNHKQHWHDYVNHSFRALIIYCVNTYAVGADDTWPFTLKVILYNIIAFGFFSCRIWRYFQGIHLFFPIKTFICTSPIFIWFSESIWRDDKSSRISQIHRYWQKSFRLSWRYFLIYSSR